MDISVLIKNLEAIKMPPNFLYIKNLVDIIEYQRMADAVKTQLDKYFTSYISSIFVDKKKALKLIIPTDHEKFFPKKYKSLEEYIDNEIVDGRRYSGTYHGGVYKMIIDYNNFKIIPVRGEIEKIEMIDDYTVLRIKTELRKYFRFNYDKHCETEHHWYDFCAKTNTYLGERKKPFFEDFGR